MCYTLAAIRTATFTTRIGILGSCFFSPRPTFDNELNMNSLQLHVSVSDTTCATAADFEGSYLPFQWCYGAKNLHVF